MKIFHKGFWIGKTLLRKCKTSKTIHVVYVHPYDITRNFFLPKCPCYLWNSGVRHVAPTRLMITQGPLWWHKHITNCMRQSYKNICWRSKGAKCNNRI
nr:hypothetical protein Iba_chr13cCG8290 [Ipomoea batatas]